MTHLTRNLRIHLASLHENRALNTTHCEKSEPIKIQEGLLTNVQEYSHVTKLFASQTSNSHLHKYILGQLMHK